MNKIHRDIGNNEQWSTRIWDGIRLEYYLCLCDFENRNIPFLTKGKKKVTCKRCLKIMRGKK